MPNATVVWVVQFFFSHLWHFVGLIFVLFIPAAYTAAVISETRR